MKHDFISKTLLACCTNLATGFLTTAMDLKCRASDYVTEANIPALLKFHIQGASKCAFYCPVIPGKGIKF